MFPLKRFVQGPSLHEENVFQEAEPTKVATGTLTGEEASKAYEEIISLPPSISSKNATDLPESTVKKPANSPSSNKKRHSPGVRQQVPSLRNLMTLCEDNNFKDLKTTLNTYTTKVDVNAQDEYGWTLLMSASCAGSLQCVSALLQKGANWYITDKKGLTALGIAAKNRRDSVCQLLQEWNDCYFERQRRLQQLQLESQETKDRPEAGPSNGRYCELCKFQYEESSTDMHEKSIAHLVSTAEFGGDKAHFGIPESNKGFQLMIKSGWDKSSGLGPDGQGHKFPVKTVLKRNKLGLGNEQEKKAARITHFHPFDSAAVETVSERTERDITVQRRETIKQRNKLRQKEIDFRREFSSL